MSGCHLTHPPIPSNGYEQKKYVMYTNPPTLTCILCKKGKPYAKKHLLQSKRRLSHMMYKGSQQTIGYQEISQIVPGGKVIQKVRLWSASTQIRWENIASPKKRK